MNKFEMVDAMYFEGITDKNGDVKDQFKSDEYREALEACIMVLEYSDRDSDLNRYLEDHDYDCDYMTYDNLCDMWFELTGEEWDW